MNSSMFGPFEICEPIGAGQMGTVWRGRHQSHGQPVAIKILRSELTGRDRYTEGFYREVSSIARLDHPYIIQVYDYGTVSEQAARQSDDIEAGALWLAMEYAPKGSLVESHQPTWSWPSLRQLLLQLLDALAHAHARGLVHRDLKPDNVLHRPGEDAGWMLSDFGIVHLQDPQFHANTTDMDNASAGTPLYMAPEQFEARWRDFGPWTDLYALGCMAYQLASARTPFSGSTAVALGIKHLSESVPPLQPRMAVPPGFENWILRLLEKSVHHRYQRAAHAGRDLLLLGDPLSDDDERDKPSIPALNRQLTWTLTHDTSSLEHSWNKRTQLLDEEALEATVATDRRAANSGDDGASSHTVTGRPVPPESWRRPAFSQTENRRSNIPGSGKEIFTIRQPAFVGRLDERDALWAHFRRVADTEKPQFICVEGAAGRGKSRLLQWLSTRAHELGAATALTATHSPIMTPGDGLIPVLRAHFGATGLDRQELWKRLDILWKNRFGASSFDAEELAALVEWMDPRQQEDADEIPCVRLESPFQRFRVAEQVLALLCTERPVILGIDDAQWAQETLGFALHLLTDTTSKPLPVLIVATLRSDSLQGRPAESEYLELLGEHRSSTAIAIDPLETDEQAQLINSVLGLTPTLVDRVCDVVSGNPLFASELIEDWISRDALAIRTEGYELLKGEEIPPTIDELLEHRIDEIASGWRDPEQARYAMEAAAALGIDVDRREWDALCRALDLTIENTLIDHFMARGLAVPHPSGWRFRLPLYRDTLARMSQRIGRSHRIHAAVDDALRQLYPCDDAVAERRARHLLAANAPRQAIPLLWHAVDNRIEESAYTQVQSLLSMLSDVFDELNYDQTHEDRIRLALCRAESHRHRGDFDATRSYLEEPQQLYDRLSVALRAEFHRVKANLFPAMRDFESARKEYERALSLYDSIDDTRGVVKSLDGLGWAYRCLGDLESSCDFYSQGIERATSPDLNLEKAWCLNGLGDAMLEGGDLSGQSYTEEALALFESIGSRSGMAIALRCLGGFARARRDFKKAREYYERALHRANTSGHHHIQQVCIVLLGFCDLEDDKLDDAQRRFEHFRETIQEEEFFFGPLGILGLLTVASIRSNKARFDELSTNIEVSLKSTTPIHGHILRTLQFNAKTWRDRGDKERTQRLESICDLVRDMHS